MGRGREERKKPAREIPEPPSRPVLVVASPSIWCKVPPAGGGTAGRPRPTGRRGVRRPNYSVLRAEHLSEFELASGFLAEFIAAAERAEGRGEVGSDATEFARYCGRAGVEPTAERLQFVRDLAVVVRDGLVADGLASSGPAARGGTHALHALALAEGLEDRGWPLSFLARATGGVGLGTAPRYGTPASGMAPLTLGPLPSLSCPTARTRPAT